MAVAPQEGADLLALAKEPNIEKELQRVGADPQAVHQLEIALGAARSAQSNWVVVRDNLKSKELIEAEQQGQQLRADTVGAARFALKNDRKARATRTAIQAGEGIADLIQDLSDLAEFVERNAGAFERDQTFDASTRVARARSLAKTLATSTAEAKLGPDQATAKNVRDRAYTYLDDLMTELREAGRYAFRNDRALVRRFSSRYLRRRRRSAAEAAVDLAPVDSESIAAS